MKLSKSSISPNDAVVAKPGGVVTEKALIVRAVFKVYPAHKVINTFGSKVHNLPL